MNKYPRNGLCRVIDMLRHTGPASKLAVYTVIKETQGILCAVNQQFASQWVFFLKIKQLKHNKSMHFSTKVLPLRPLRNVEEK